MKRSTRPLRIPRELANTSINKPHVCAPRAWSPLSKKYKVDHVLLSCLFLKNRGKLCLAFGPLKKHLDGGRGGNEGEGRGHLANKLVLWKDKRKELRDKHAVAARRALVHIQWSAHWRGFFHFFYFFSCTIWCWITSTYSCYLCI